MHGLRGSQGVMPLGCSELIIRRCKDVSCSGLITCCREGLVQAQQAKHAL